MRRTTKYVGRERRGRVNVHLIGVVRGFNWRGRGLSIVCQRVLDVVLILQIGYIGEDRIRQIRNRSRRPRIERLRSAGQVRIVGCRRVGWTRPRIESLRSAGQVRIFGCRRVSWKRPRIECFRSAASRRYQDADLLERHGCFLKESTISRVMHVDPDNNKFTCLDDTSLDGPSFDNSSFDGPFLDVPCLDDPRLDGRSFSTVGASSDESSNWESSGSISSSDGSCSIFSSRLALRNSAY